MRKLIFCLFLFTGMLVSCDKPNEVTEPEEEMEEIEEVENPISANINFSKHILEDYFVRSIAFDQLGNAWIGTFKQGLIKYNATGITVFNAENSIISDDMVIYDLAVDSKNQVWIGTSGMGLLKYDGTGFTQYHTANAPIPEDVVMHVAVDSKDQVWFSSCRSRQGGLVKYDQTNWQVYTPANSPLPGNLIHGIAIDAADNVWVSMAERTAGEYLVKISGTTWHRYTDTELGFKPYQVGDIAVNSKGQLCGSISYWTASFTPANAPQAYIFNQQVSKQLRFDGPFLTNCIFVDKNDHIWTGGDRVFAVYNGREWTVNNTIMEKNAVFAIAGSPSNTIWLGTGKGIYINE